MSFAARKAELEKEKKYYAGTVGKSFELKRIFALPRRVLDLAQVEDVTSVFAKGDLRFWPIQSAALIEAAENDGLFAMIGVGHGKTLIGLSLPTAMDSQKAVYLVEPGLKAQLEREIDEFYTKHFELPIDRITIVSYSQLSSKKNADILDEIWPDLIVCDESQNLKDPKSARTKRFLRHLEANPSCRVALLSGTTTTRSLFDYAHLIELALRKNSPLPGGYHELRGWAGVFDADPREPFRPGYFEKLAADPDVPGDTPVEVFQRRLVETPGVVRMADPEAPCPLYIRGLDVEVPKRVMELMQQVSQDWELHDEEDGYLEEFAEASERWRKLRELGCGFYYVWDWPDGEPDCDWLEARANWNREVRAKLKYSRPGMDSPGLIEDAAERYFQWVEAGRVKEDKPELGWDSYYYPAWREQKQKPEPPQLAKWIDTFMIDACRAWAEKNKEGIIWYEHKALGARIAEDLELPHYGAGDDASTATAPVIVCSIRAQGTGKNLQRYNRNLFTSLPPSGKAFEQTVGRTHRNGQQADEVFVEYISHTGRGSLESIQRDAQYVQDTTGDRQKALYGTYIAPATLKVLNVSKKTQEKQR